MRTSRLLWAMLSMAGLLLTAPSEVTGQSDESRRVRVTRPAMPGGVGQYAPGTWGLVNVEVVNPTDQPAQVLTVAYFAGNPHLQFGRELWLPPQSRRTSWYPVRTPDQLSNKSTQAELTTLVFDRSRGEILMRDREGELLPSAYLPIEQGSLVTGFVAGAPTDDSAQWDDAYELLVALRLAGGLSRRTTQLHEDFLPPLAASLETLNQLVLMDGRLAEDAAAVSAVRHWLMAGGRLWIMLDLVDESAVERLLGDLYSGSVVGRVGLTEVAIQDARTRETIGSVREFEVPVDFVQVVADDVEVEMTVNGWPAAFWKTVGRGEVLLTTLGPHAWMHPREEHDPAASKPRVTAGHLAEPALKQLARRFFESAPEEHALLVPADWKPYLTEQIGYKIAGRNRVFAILGAFCLVICVSGVWLMRRQQLERLAWIAPLSAVAAAVPLIAMGTASRQTVPATVAAGQFVDVQPGIGEVRVTGLMGLYNQDVTETPLGAERGGVQLPDMPAGAGRTHRMVWTDLNRWHWENLTLPAGVTFARFSQATQLTQPIEVRATFGPHGLRGTIESGPFSEVEDAIIATSARRSIAVDFDADGTFRAGPEHVLDPGGYVSDRLLSDEQRRRQTMLETLLAAEREVTYPHQPTLLFWSDPLDLHFRFPEGMQRAGSALVTAPVQWERPDPGTRVVFPAPFLPYQAVPTPDNPGIPSTYNRRSGQWNEYPSATKTGLRFQVPTEMLPVRLDRATLTIKINAAMRRMTITSGTFGNLATVGEQESPVGTFRFEIEGEEALRLDPAGGLHVVIDIGDIEAPPDELGNDVVVDENWKIEFVALEAAGETLTP